MRKGFALPRVSALTNTLGSAGRLSLPAEPRGRREAACAESPKLSAFRTRGRAKPLSPDFSAAPALLTKNKRIMFVLVGKHPEELEGK
jgi:hypothetical protein